MTLAKAINSYWKAATMRTKHAGKSLPSHAAGLGYPYLNLNHGPSIVGEVVLLRFCGNRQSKGPALLLGCEDGWHVRFEDGFPEKRRQRVLARLGK